MLMRSGRLLAVSCADALLVSSSASGVRGTAAAYRALGREAQGAVMEGPPEDAEALRKRGEGV